MKHGNTEFQGTVNIPYEVANTVADDTIGAGGTLTKTISLDRKGYQHGIIFLTWIVGPGGQGKYGAVVCFNQSGDFATIEAGAKGHIGGDYTAAFDSQRSSAQATGKWVYDGNHNIYVSAIALNSDGDTITLTFTGTFGYHTYSWTYRALLW